MRNRARSNLPPVARIGANIRAPNNYVNRENAFRRKFLPEKKSSRQWCEYIDCMRGLAGSAEETGVALVADMVHHLIDCFSPRAQQCLDLFCLTVE